MLPRLKGSGSDPAESLSAVRRELKKHVSSTIEEAREPGSWAFQTLMSKLKVHDEETKMKRRESARGQTFVSENKTQTGRFNPSVHRRILEQRIEKDREHALSVIQRRNEVAAEKIYGLNTHTADNRAVGLARDRAVGRYLTSNYLLVLLAPYFDEPSACEMGHRGGRPHQRCSSISLGGRYCTHVKNSSAWPKIEVQT